MRIIITGSGMLLIVAICIIINSVIISTHMRDNEVTNGLDKATDYAIDVLSDHYERSEFKKEDAQQYVTEVLHNFCAAVNEKIGTDGVITIKVVHADIVSGTFDLVITETYQYPIKGKTGQCSYEKAFSLI